LDDEQDAREIVSAIVGDAGADVAAAASGHQALST
jgi:CheY-like chemotaxis protein